MRVWLLSVLGALLLAAVGVLGVGAWRGDVGGPAGVSTIDLVPDSVDYVALGDSYTAGPLIPMQRDDAPGCFRSTRNYPAYLAELLGVATYLDASCSGATSDAVTRRQALLFDQRNPPQRTALSEETDLVTVGLGGNDFGLFGSLSGGCGGDWRSDTTPCRDRFGDSKVRDARRVRATLGEALRAVRHAAPEADVYVVGYPRLLPEEGSCRAAGFTAGDAAWAGEVARSLNRSLEQAAADAGATYVDLYPASEGHDICAGEDAWVNGLDTQMGAAAAFHPFEAGMRGTAAAVYEAITGEPAPAVTGGLD